VPAVEELHARIRERSPLTPAETEEVIRKRFASVPRRLSFGLDHWPLAESAVLDVGSSWGHCLAQFGPGSVGIDSVRDQVDFCNALGLDARLADANRGLAEVPDGSFDFAWVSDIVEHLDAPRLLLRNVRPKLKPDGHLILVTTVLPSSPLVAALMRRTVYRGFDAEAHHYQFTLATVRFLFERAGYRVVSASSPYPLPIGLAPRIYVDATPDVDAEQLALEAERRNRGAFDDGASD
jgi:2-polyprenyl-3-methyl-5-hydroxy-6-metoxy-1,4-benzoquinol methylase